MQRSPSFQILRIHYYHLLQITAYEKVFPELQATAEATQCKHPNNADKLQSKMFP